MRRVNLRKDRTAHVGTIRDINRRIVLNYVRDKEPISRAEIAREALLQRSTVSIIVETLKTEGLIEEIGAGQSTGGRRPTLLRLCASGMTAIGVDIAPLRTTVAKSDFAGRILKRREFPTDAKREKTLAKVIKSVRELAGEGATDLVEAIGVSLPGLVDPSNGIATYIPYFNWREWPIAKELSAATGLQVIIDNDANAAALAELWFGRREVSEARDFIMVLISEGIGTGIIFDGQIYRGARSAAGEFGHMVVGEKSLIACSCGNRDCWEAFASGRAAVARYAKSSRRRNGSNNHAIAMSDVVDRALGGEKAAVGALVETAHYLGIGISNLIVGLSPEAVIVGGEIIRAWPLIAGALEETVQRSIRRGLPSVQIIASTLGSQPTLMGAISLVLARKFASTRAA